MDADSVCGHEHSLVDVCVLSVCHAGDGRRLAAVQPDSTVVHARDGRADGGHGFHHALPAGRPHHGRRHQRAPWHRRGPDVRGQCGRHPDSTPLLALDRGVECQLGESAHVHDSLELLDSHLGACRDQRALCGCGLCIRRARDFVVQCGLYSHRYRSEVAVSSKPLWKWSDFHCTYVDITRNG